MEIAPTYFEFDEQLVFKIDLIVWKFIFKYNIVRISTSLK